MLVSPLTAAVIAVEGKIVDARNFLGNEVLA
jgi:homoaconitase/3-isopropylmalate dehydratase large subunit